MPLGEAELVDGFIFNDQYQIGTVTDAPVDFALQSEHPWLWQIITSSPRMHVRFVPCQ